MIKTDAIFLFRSDLILEHQKLPVDEIKVFHFKYDAYQEIKLCSLVVFVDGENTKILKNKYQGVNL